MKGRFDELAEALLMRRAGIRAKVSLALLGVVALVVPQIALTITYMVDLFAHGEQVESLSKTAASVGQLTELSSQLFLEEIPKTSESLQERHRRLGKLQQAIVTASENARPEIQSTFADAATALAEYSTKLTQTVQAAASQDSPKNAWLTSLAMAQTTLGSSPEEWRERYPQPQPRQLMHRVTQLEGQLFELLPRVMAQAVIQNSINALATTGRQRAERAHLRHAAQKTLSSLERLRGQLHHASAQSGSAIRMTVNRADRYLITLVLITVVYLLSLVLVLPGRLVQPLKHITAVMNRAGQGQLHVQARTAGDDEMGALATALNRMLNRLKRFDTLKRNRIYEDAVRIRILADMISSPVVLLDTRHRVEHANQAFRRLFSLPDDYEDTQLLTLLEGPDLPTLREYLDTVLLKRRPIKGRKLTLSDRRGQHEFLLSVDIGRNRRGAVGVLILRLEPPKKS